jgi:hypothetical protein
MPQPKAFGRIEIEVNDCHHVTRSERCLVCALNFAIQMLCCLCQQEHDFKNKYFGSLPPPDLKQFTVESIIHLRRNHERQPPTGPCGR